MIAYIICVQHRIVYATHRSVRTNSNDNSPATTRDHISSLAIIIHSTKLATDKEV